MENISELKGTVDTFSMWEIRSSMDRDLQYKIADRQLAVRREEYENALRCSICSNMEKARLITTYIANYFSFCEYAKKMGGFIPFDKELYYLENYFLMEQYFFGEQLILHRDCDITDFAIPSFTLYPLVREAALNLVCCDQPAEIWISTRMEEERIRITIRHDVPEKSLRDEEFRESNAYGFSLLKDRIAETGGILTRRALPEGLMEVTMALQVRQSDTTGPVYVWF